jgi:protoporphyrinogen oxidase
MKYDYVIVGGGPTGLTIAYYLNKNGYKCALIDMNESLGGCHRVKRVNGLFTEHGPRVYSNNYVNFIQILNEFGYKFEDLFKEYNFQLSNIAGKSISRLSIKELLLLGIETLKLIYTDKSKRISVEQFSNKYNFKEDSKDYLDRVSRLTDGADIKRTSLNQLLELNNQHFFYKLYQPSKPNDKQLFKIWESKLNGVVIYKNTKVENIEIKSNEVSALFINSKFNSSINKIESKNYIFCIPPRPYTELLKNSNLQYKQEELITNENSYFNYLPIIFHWNKKLNLPKIWGLSETDYGIGFIVLSDYMDFEDNRSKTVISTCITRPNSKSKYINKTANEINNEKELIDEVFRQLKESYNDLEEPTISILNPSIKRINNEWIEIDTAYVRSYKQNYIKSKNEIYNNLYFVGAQNGNSYYSATAIESAVQNALHFLNEYVLEKKNKIKIKQIITLIDVIKIILILIIFFLIRKFYLKRKK